MLTSFSAASYTSIAKAPDARQAEDGIKSEKASTATSSANGASTKVTLSGKAVMLSRLFNTTDPSLEPKVETNKSKPAGLVFDFLTHDDRQMLAKLYDYAGSNGVDPLKVDNVAFDLACYRQSEGILGYHGCDYDLTGQPVARSFNPADEAIAQRILTSKAVNDTGIDHGFLSKILDPGYFSKHASDFQFLQQVVFAFSASGSDGAADPNAKPVVRPQASDFSPIKIEQADDGKSLVQERLFGLTRSGERVPSAVNSPLLGYLTDMDLAFLTGKYDEALRRGEGREGIEKVDKLALLLATQRWSQQMISMLSDERQTPSPKRNSGDYLSNFMK